MMSKIIGEDLLIPSMVPWPHHAYIGRMEGCQLLYKHLCPLPSLEQGIIIHAIKILHVVEVRLHHSIILSPGWLLGVVAFEEMKSCADMFRTPRNNIPIEFFCEDLQLSIIGKKWVCVVISKIKVV